MMKAKGFVAVAAACAMLVPPAGAQTEPFLGQLMWVGNGFCPRGWAEANGQLLPINQNQALFSLLGTTYGGDGRVNFALPNLRGRAAVHAGQGPGLPGHTLGELYGQETTTLTANQMPAHTHGASTTVTARANSSPADSASPTGNVLAETRTNRVYSTAAATVDMDATSISAPTIVGNAGGGQPFSNTQPTLVLRACIALVGIFPSQN